MEFFKCDACGCVRSQNVQNTRTCNYTNFNKSVHKEKGELYVDVHAIQICDSCLNSHGEVVKDFCGKCEEEECASDCYHYDEWYGLQKGKLPKPDPDLRDSNDTSNEDIRNGSKVFRKWLYHITLIIWLLILTFL